VEVYQGDTPNVIMNDGDLYIGAACTDGAWGDPLERDLHLVEQDVYYGWLTPDVAETNYGVVIDEDAKAKVKETEDLRRRMRQKRQEDSVDARDWWGKAREQVQANDFSEDVYNMYSDSLKYEKFRRGFAEMWQLPDDYQL